MVRDQVLKVRKKLDAGQSAEFELLDLIIRIFKELENHDPRIQYNMKDLYDEMW